MKDIIKKKGFTLIELMIVVAILGIVVLGLTKIFKTFLDSWWLSRTKLTTQEDAREAAYWIVKEFKGGRRTTLGSVVANSGFELGTGEDDPYLWDIDYDPVTETAVSRHSSSEVESTATVRTGEYSLEINDFANFSGSFESESFEVTSSTDYLLSGWFRIEDAKIERFQLKQGGSTFLSVSSAGPLQGDWENLTSSGFLNAGTYSVEVIYSADSPPAGSIYVDDISLTPLKWEMIDDAGLIKNSTYYYTTQTGSGGETEGTLHAMVVETMATSDGEKNRLIRKRLTSGWPSKPNYTDDIYGGTWRTIGFNTLADNISYLSFTLGSPSKDSPLNISLKVTGTPTGEGKEQEFDVRTQVYPLTE